MIYGFSANIVPLKGVSKEGWNSIQFMTQVELGDSIIVIHCRDSWSNYRDDDSTFYYNDSSRHAFLMNFYRLLGLVNATNVQFT